MKKYLVSILTIIFPFSFGLAATQTSLDSVSKTVVNSGSSKLNDSMHKTGMPEWLQRTDIGFGLEERNKPEYEINTIQPIYQNLLNTVFWQGRVAYKGYNTTLNFGSGYRHLTPSENMMFGLNAFFDTALRYHHKRLGLGGEMFTRYATLRANYYQAISGKTIVSNESGIQTYEKALTGYDGSVETPMPFLPWVRFILTGYHWSGYLGDNINGGKFSFRMTPWSNLEIEAGSGKDNATRWQAFLTANWYLDRPAHIEYRISDQLFSKQVFTPTDITKHRLEKVRRQNDIVVERGTISASGGTFVIKRGT